MEKKLRIINAAGGRAALAGYQVDIYIENDTAHPPIGTIAGGQIVLVNQDNNETHTVTVPRIAAGSNWRGQAVFNSNYPDKYGLSIQGDGGVQWTDFGVDPVRYSYLGWGLKNDP